MTPTRKQLGKEYESPLTSMPMEPPWFQCEIQSIQDKNRPGSWFAGITQVDLANVYTQIKLAPERQMSLALSTYRGVLLRL